jgi:hypothetical protein
MADKFVDYETKVCADWLNVVDWAVFDALGQPQTPDEARTNIGAVEEAPNDGLAYMRYGQSWQPLSLVTHNSIGGRDQTNAHPIAAITNLQTTLNGKAASVHQHTLNDVTDAGDMAYEPDAPSDGNQYARWNGQWTIVSGGGGGSGDHQVLVNRDLPDQHPIGAITDLQDTLDLKLEDAPSDDLTYGRHNGTWQAISSGGDGGDHALLINRDLADQHPQSAITGLSTALSGKANAVHTHAISDVTGLQTALDGKADDIHTHAIADVTGLQTALDGKQATITGAATTITTSNLTVSRALISNSSGKVAVHSTVSDTELGYLDGVSGPLQEQINAKLSDAPSDGKQYGRQSGSWTAVAAGDHSLLTNRNLADQHTVAAITGLQSALDGKQPLDADLTSIAGLSGTSGFLKKTAADSWSLDTSTYALSSHTHSTYLLKAGDTMSGTLNMGNNQISGAKTVTFNGEYNAGTYTGSQSILLTNGQKQTMILAASGSLLINTTGAACGHYQIRFQQNSSGGFTPDMSAVISDGEWIGTAGQPEFNTDPLGQTIVTIFHNGSSIMCASAVMVGK